MTAQDAQIALGAATLRVMTSLSADTMKRVRARKGSHLVYVDRTALAELLEAVEAAFPGATAKMATHMVDRDKRRAAAAKAARKTAQDAASAAAAEYRRREAALDYEADRRSAQAGGAR